MRRTALTIVFTIVGLVLLLQFKTHGPGTATGALANLGASTPVSRTSSRPSSPAASPSHHAVTQAHHHAKPSSPPSTSAPASSAPSTVTATGRTAITPYGPVQVKIVETDGRLTDVTAVQLPSDSAHSSEIAAAAVPILRSEALRAGSTHIDVVSGATYTSDGYAQSLQSALDRA